MFQKITTQSNNIPNSQVAQNHTPQISQKQLMQIKKRFGLKQDASEYQVVEELYKILLQPQIYNKFPQKVSQIEWCLKHKLNSQTCWHHEYLTQQCDDPPRQIEDLQHIPPTNNETNKKSEIIALLNVLKKYNRENIPRYFQQIKSTQSVILLSFLDIEEQHVGGAINEYNDFLTNFYNLVELVAPFPDFQNSYFKFKEKRLATGLVQYLILEGQFKGFEKVNFKKIMIQEVRLKISLDMVEQYELKAILETLKEFFDSKPEIEQNPRRICFTKEDRRAAVFTSFMFKLANKRI